MSELNKGTKRLIRLLNKQKGYLHDNIGKVVRENIAKQSLETCMPKNNVFSLSVEQDSSIEKLVDYEINNLTGEAKDNFQVLRLVDWVIERLNEHKGFNDFVILEDLFSFFDFPKEYQLDVLGYVIRTNVDCFLDLEKLILDNEKRQELEATEFFQYKFSEEIKKLNIGCGITDLETKAFEYLKKPEFRNHLTNIFNSYKTVGNYVKENGEFVASPDIETFYNALKVAGIKLTPKQKELIVTEIKRLEEEKNRELNKENMLHETIESNEVNLINKKEQWESLQILKKYLDEETPKQYIASHEFILISNALINLGYSDNKIAKIQKAIVLNNQRLLGEKATNSYISAKHKYLAETEIDVLNHAEILISDREAVVNPIFNKIKDDLEFVKEELIKVYDANDDNNVALNDDAELIIWGITELKDGLINYGHSNYKYSRELSKKD